MAEEPVLCLRDQWNKMCVANNSLACFCDMELHKMKKVTETCVMVFAFSEQNACWQHC